MHRKIAAIVSAFNEASRIAPVLKTLQSVNEIDEIIVVDDGSTDNLHSVVARFPKIRYLRSEVNIGKGASMDKGVRATQASLILFCDADLRDLTPEHIKRILAPIRKGTYDMYIGLCGSKMQQSIKNWALNSGQRALKRSIWENLPAFYKRGYRIETGLNLLVSHFGRGYGYETLPYSQYVKERKHGLLVGTLMRNKMNMEILYVTLRFLLYDWIVLRCRGFRIK